MASALSVVSFVLDGVVRTVEMSDRSSTTPTTTLLQYLRTLPGHSGTKEGCAEGDCGACTVLVGEWSGKGSIRYKHIDACLVFLPMVHGKHVVTVENVARPDGSLHPVQEAMVETGGSQCGYCTPGFIMSMMALYRESTQPTREQIDDALTGNLCRCTGYRPIVEAAARSCANGGVDHLTDHEPETRTLLASIPHRSLHLTTGTQTYHQPSTVKEALRLKQEHPSALVITGATDVALRVTKRHELLKEIIDLSNISELKAIAVSGVGLEVGGGAPLEEVLHASREHFPALHEILTVFGSRQIRNLATLGGNLGSASPIGDTIPVLMAYHAKVILQNVKGRREVPVTDFITGYRTTVMKPQELITGVTIPKPEKGITVRSYKVSKRKDLDIATVSAGFRLERIGGSTVNNATLAYGGMADRTKRAEKTEEYLAGKPWTREVVEEAMKILETEFLPISDARSGAEFRRVAARNLLLKFWCDTTRP